VEKVWEGKNAGLDKTKKRSVPTKHERRGGALSKPAWKQWVKVSAAEHGIT
jgi:hypothetical protein